MASHFTQLIAAISGTVGAVQHLISSQLAVTLFLMKCVKESQTFLSSVK
uniref:Uncharacterized protein n=1 Tax=Anguilla anguilla TaxID=7936 RepID=A0A0E9S0Q1_ANGAN